MSKQREYKKEYILNYFKDVYNNSHTILDIDEEYHSDDTGDVGNDSYTTNEPLNNEININSYQSDRSSLLTSPSNLPLSPRNLFSTINLLSPNATNINNNETDYNNINIFSPENNFLEKNIYSQKKKITIK